MYIGRKTTLISFWYNVRATIEHLELQLGGDLNNPKHLSRLIKYHKLRDAPTRKQKWILIFKRFEADPRVQKLRKLIKENGMTIEEFSEQVALYYRVASSYIHGKPFSQYSLDIIKHFSTKAMKENSKFKNYALNAEIVQILFNFF